MLFGEIIRVALGALRANKLRSMLTMLGIVIGALICHFLFYVVPGAS
mgnify:CR=1 FL=1